MASSSISPPAPQGTAVDPLFAKEQRRFRRLEVTLPVWITTRDAYKEGLDVWELGYTRDISMGGCKIIVPGAEEIEWRQAQIAKTPFVLRFDIGAQKENVQGSDVIFAHVRNVSWETNPKKTKGQAGQLALGIQFLDEARGAREATLRAGLATKNRRRAWQLAFVLALLITVCAFWSIKALRGEVAARDAQIAKLQNEATRVTQKISLLSKPKLVSTKSEGVDIGFQQAQAQQTLTQLRQNIARLNNPTNMQAAIKQREDAAKKLGISLTPPSTKARVQFAVAFPYGYNWPLVLGDLESALGRKVPHVVIFNDWTMKFPDLDAREARARGKVLQVTWEPWHFSNPRAVKLYDIATGKYDAYIDAWAAGARSFGGEIWIRWGHEMNGNWYPWSLANNGQNAIFWKAAYKRIHDRFRRAGAFNVRWIWCINAESVPAAKWNDPFNTYPGDDYVDAVAIDGYNFGRTTAYSRWQSFGQIFAVPYTRAIKQFPNKPLFIAETGCATTGGDKSRWLRDMDQDLRGAFSKVESVTWFEAAKEADWRLLSSEDTAKTARQIFGNPVYRRGAG